MARPVIGICAAVERARWGVWDQDAFLIARSYVAAIQEAGGLAIVLPPDQALIDDPDEVLDLLDGLILAGGADIDPGATAPTPIRRRRARSRERDTFEIALTRRALERDLPLLGICRGMQLLNVARGGTLEQHLPGQPRPPRPPPGARDVRRRRPRRPPRRGLARAADGGRGRPRHEVAPPPGHRGGRRGLRGHGLGRHGRAARGDGGPGAALRARRPVAPGGRRGEPLHRARSSTRPPGARRRGVAGRNGRRAVVGLTAGSRFSAAAAAEPLGRGREQDSATRAGEPSTSRWPRTPRSRCEARRRPDRRLLGDVVGGRDTRSPTR